MLRTITRAAGLMALALALALAAGPALAAVPSPLVTLEPVFSFSAYPQGQTHPMAFRLKVAKGYHVNARNPGDPDLVPTLLSVSAGPGLSVGDVTYPKPYELKMPFLDRPAKVYGGSVLFYIPLKVAADAAPGEHSLTLHLSYQGCNETMCLMPEEIERKIKVRVAPAGATVQKLNPGVFKP